MPGGDGVSKKLAEVIGVLGVFWTTLYKSCPTLMGSLSHVQPPSTSGTKLAVLEAHVMCTGPQTMQEKRNEKEDGQVSNLSGRKQQWIGHARQTFLPSPD